MANYNEATKRFFSAEGYIEGNNMGYVNDSNDRGGETIAGIARNSWGKEPIWVVVDAAKKQPNFPKSLTTNLEVAKYIREFYKKNFWDKIGGDRIKSQNIATEMMDAVVNYGISPGVKMAQRIVGLPETGKIDDLLIEKLSYL